MNKDTIRIIKAMRRQRREEEIAAFGKPLKHTNVVRSKKLYTRKLKHKKSAY